MVIASQVNILTGEAQSYRSQNGADRLCSSRSENERESENPKAMSRESRGWASSVIQAEWRTPTPPHTTTFKGYALTPARSQSCSHRTNGREFGGGGFGMPEPWKWRAEHEELFIHPRDPFLGEGSLVGVSRRPTPVRFCQSGNVLFPNVVVISRFYVSARERVFLRTPGKS